MWIERKISDLVTKAFRQFPAVILTGPRQSGKTTLVRHLFPAASYVTLDIPREADSARLDGERFLKNLGEPAIIDEIQYAPSLFRFLKASIDKDRRPGRFLLTGSQDFALMEGVSESLAGRCAIVSLSTLSLEETVNDASRSSVDKFVWRGGFPEFWSKVDIDRDLWLGSYLATYLERDVRNVLRLGGLRDFDRFMRAAALRVGCLLSFSELARDVGIAPNTIKSWISVLVASRQIQLLEPYHNNAGKRLVKTPKLYFMDSGLLLYLLGFQRWDAVPVNALFGAIWENLVVSETVKYFQNRGIRPPCFFYQTSTGEEVDLLVELAPKSFLGLECKTASDITNREMKGFEYMRENFGSKSLVKGAVVCRTENAYPLAKKNVSAIPAAGKDGLANWLETQF